MPAMRVEPRAARGRRLQIRSPRETGLHNLLCTVLRFTPWVTSMMKTRSANTINNVPHTHDPEPLCWTLISPNKTVAIAISTAIPIITITMRGIIARDCLPMDPTQSTRV